MKNETVEKVLSRILLVGIPLLFFLPLYVQSQFYFPFITPRSFVFRIAVEIFFASYLILLLIDWKKYSPGRSRIIWLFTGLTAWLTISSIFGGNLAVSFWGNYERMDGLINNYHLIALLIMIAGLYRERRFWRELVYYSIFVSFIVGFIAIAQHYNLSILLESAGGERVSSTLGNPAYVGTYGLFHIFFSLYLLVKYGQKFLVGRSWRPALISLFRKAEEPDAPDAALATTAPRRMKMELVSFILFDILIVGAELAARAQGNPGTLAVIFSQLWMALLWLVPQFFVLLNFFYRRHRLAGLMGFYASLALINFAAIFFTQTRGALVGLVVGIALILFLAIFLRPVPKKIRVSAAAFFILLIILVSAVYYFRDSAGVRKVSTLARLTSISWTDTTTQARFLTWGAGWQGFKERPILGWGVERFYVVFNKYFPAEVYRHAGSRVWYDRAHNIYVEYLVQGGAVALSLYLSIFITAFYLLWRQARRNQEVSTALIFSGLIVAYAIQNAFVFDSINTYPLLILMLAGIIIYSADNKVGQDTRWTKLLGGPRLFISALVLILLNLIAIFTLNIAQLQKNLHYVQWYENTRNAKDTQSLEYANDQLVRVIARGAFLGTHELRQSYSELAVELAANSTLPMYLRRNIIDQAAEQLNKSIASEPDNARHYAFLTNLYLVGAQLDPSYAEKNLEVIERGLQLSSRRTPFYFSQGRAFIILERYDEAIAAFQKAVSISPQVTDAHLNLLAAYVTAGKDQEAKDEFDLIRRSNLIMSQINYTALGRVLRIGDYDEQAQTVLEEAVEKYPQEAIFYSELAKVYFNLDKKNEALATAEQAAQLDSRYQDLVEQIKSELLPTQQKK